MLLHGKVAMITGSATGIGNAVARLFAEHGAGLLLIDRNQQPNEATAAELGKAGPESGQLVWMYATAHASMPR